MLVVVDIGCVSFDKLSQKGDVRVQFSSVQLTFSVFVYVYLFIKSYRTAQSDPVILVVLCFSQWFSQGGINLTHVTKTYTRTRQKGHTISRVLFKA